MLWDKTGASPDSFTAASPVAYARDLQTVFQEEAQGVSLEDMLLSEDDAVPAARKVARALSTLHLGDIAVPLRRLLLQDEIVVLEKRGRMLWRICPHLGPKVEAIIGLVVANIEEVPPAPVHGDLNLGHIVLDGDRLTLIDLDDFAEADPLVDVARLLASFVTTSYRFSLPHGPTRAAARAFAEEYFSCVPGGWRAGLPLRYAGALLRAASGLFQKRVPGWPEKIEAMVEEAGASLRDETW